MENVKHSSALIIGYDSAIGNALFTKMSALNWDVMATTRRNNNENLIYLDLSEDIKDFDLLETDVVVICAAQTKLSLCRESEARSYKINVTAPLAIAERAISKGSFVLFLSTLAVFDGDKEFRRLDEIPKPKSVYGKQKLEAEKQLQQLGGDICILRITKVVNESMSLIVNWIKNLNEGKIITPFSDMRIAPVLQDDVIDVIEKLCLSRYEGLYQYSGSRDASYEEIARYICERLSKSPNLINPVNAITVGISEEEIMHYSSMVSDKLCSLINIRVKDPFEIIDTAFFQ